MTEAAVLYECEQRADSIIEEADLERIEREINHNLKKQDRARRNQELGLRPDGTPLIRDADHQVQEALIGGNPFEPANNRGGGPVLNEHGMIVPVSMRNYQERDVLMGFIRLRKYDNMDLFWGLIKDTPRDLVYMHLTVLAIALFILGFCISTRDQQIKYSGNI